MKLIKTLPILLLLTACNFPGTPAPATPRPLPETPLGTGPSEADPGELPELPGAPAAEEGPPSEDGPVYKDLSIRPQIWFGPLDPWSWDQYFPGQGPFDYYNLFTAGAPWQTASDAVHVIRLYPVWLESDASPAEIKTVLDDIASRGMAISYEAGPLTETPLCNAATVEGFWGVPAAQAITKRIADAGGTLYSMDLEHAFDAGTYYDANCFMSPAEIAADAARTIAAVRAVFPDVKIGSIETADLDPGAVSTWLAAYAEVMGEELDYFHLDINFSRVDWAARALEIERVVRSRGIEFGIIYFGNHDDASDESWLVHTEQRFVEYEVLAGGSPDHVIFQSWHMHPQALLPETQPGTFTNLVLRYLRSRTTLTLEAIDDLTYTGSLSDESGNPISGAEIEIRVEPVSGAGVFAEYTITGIVPEGTAFADAGFRVNSECDCSGLAEFVLEQVVYTESGGTGGPVPNGSFAGGFEFWGIWGSGAVSIVPSSNGTGGGLKVSAQPGQDVGMNSGEIPATPGAEFTIVFTAQVSPVTRDSGYFNIIFLSASTEITRMTIPIAAAGVVVTTVQTGPDGSFQANLGDLPEGEYAITAWYAGNDDFWPDAGE